MKKTVRLLLDLANQQTLKKLPDNERYARLRSESDALWDQFRRRYPREIGRAALSVVDLYNEISSMEAENSFLLGLQLGVEIGRLDLLPEE